MKLSISYPAVTSTSWSTRGSGKLFLGHDLFKSVKSTHMHHFPFDFLTKTIFDTQSGLTTSLINPVLVIGSLLIQWRHNVHG